MSVLVHLCDPVDWRAALDGGSLRPVSLADAGFVHLSTPEQVHLPAQRLFPDRRDLVLLVVDPARLTDPVRWEPGVPGDPASMRFPHLYGPLPTSAVVAVVPWLPPVAPVLPAPDDALGRALALELSLSTRRAASVQLVPGGVAVRDPAYAASHDDNRVLLDSVDGADAVADLVSASGVGVARLRSAAGAEVAVELGRWGWAVDERVVMATRALSPTPHPGRTEVVEQAALHPLWERAWRRELAGHPDLDAVVADLVGREHRTDRVVRVHDVAVRVAGEPVAAGQLQVDGATASITAVMTEPAHRGAGHADAVLRRLLSLAADAGGDLVVLEAAADDWPRHWYARRGFAEVGRTWQAVARRS